MSDNEETIFQSQSETIGEIVLSDFLRHETRARTIGVMNPLAASSEDQLKVSQGPIVIGRDPNSDYVLPDDSVSRRHAQITPTKTGFIIEDLGSSKRHLRGRRTDCLLRSARRRQRSGREESFSL
mgnify:CR=1 FL=1